jgi:hypothetical protein
VAVTDIARYRLRPNSRGGLAVWKHPEDGRQYVLGSDAAGGGPQSDFSVCVVLEAETCDLVAMWRERMSPIPWGRACSRLGWYYNDGYIAFETGASTHGLAAVHSAIGLGYQRIYKRQRVQVAHQPEGEILGWATTSTTKPLMIARVQEALAQGLHIPSAELLTELMEQRYDEHRRVVCEHHDDTMDAYAIALLVRDRAWTHGIVKAYEPPETMDESARFWAHQEKKLSAKDKRRRMFSGA